MRKYLLSRIQKVGVILAILAYIAYIIYDADSFSINPEQFFRPYSKIIFVLLVTIFLLLMKYKNWRTNLKILTLAAVLTAMFYVASIQLQNLFSFNSKIFKADGLTYEQVGNISPVVNLQIYYRIGKIVLFDIFAIFSFWAINKTIDSIEKINE